MDGIGHKRRLPSWMAWAMSGALSAAVVTAAALQVAARPAEARPAPPAVTPRADSGVTCPPRAPSAGSFGSPLERFL